MRNYEYLMIENYENKEKNYEKKQNKTKWTVNKIKTKQKIFEYVSYCFSILELVNEQKKVIIDSFKIKNEYDLEAVALPSSSWRYPSLIHGFL